jgi:hypothetical protein
MTRVAFAKNSDGNMHSTQRKLDIASKWNGWDDKTIRDKIERMSWVKAIIDHWFHSDDKLHSNLCSDFATIILYQYRKLRAHREHNRLQAADRPDAAVRAAQLRVLNQLGPSVFKRMSKTVSPGSAWEQRQICYGFSEEGRKSVAPKAPMGDGEPGLFDLMVWEFVIPPICGDYLPNALPDFPGDVFFHALVDGFSVAVDYAEKEDERSIIRECHKILSRKPLQMHEDGPLRNNFRKALMGWYSVREPIDAEIEFVEPSKRSEEEVELDQLLARILALCSDLPDPWLSSASELEVESKMSLHTSQSAPLPSISRHQQRSTDSDIRSFSQAPL